MIHPIILAGGSGARLWPLSRKANPKKFIALTQIVLKGTARVTNGDRTYLVSESESTFIPIGQVHALESSGKIELEMVEVQSGSYLGEDDIVRFEDHYGRAGA